MTGNCIRIHERDNVAIAVRDLQKGEEIVLSDGSRPGIHALRDTPQAHKIALSDIPQGGEVIRYGVVLGTMKEDMRKGGWIHENNLQMSPAPDLDSMKFAVNLRTDLPEPPVRMWEGYRNPAGGPAETRNLYSKTIKCAKFLEKGKKNCGYDSFGC